LSLVERECWLLRHGDNPGDIAELLARLCADSPATEMQPAVSWESRLHVARTGPDLIRRFTPTPLVADLGVAGGAIRLETNNQMILQQVTKALERYRRTETKQELFLWRLVSDNDAGLQPPWPDASTLSADDLYLINMGQRSFLAGDRSARCAIGFVAEALLEDEIGFEESFLTKLLSMTFDILSQTTA